MDFTEDGDGAQPASEHEGEDNGDMFKIRPGAVEVILDDPITHAKGYWVFKKDEIKEADGALFFNLRGDKCNVRRLVAQFVTDVKAAGAHCVIANTDVIQHLVALKTAEIKSLTVGDKGVTTRYRSVLKRYVKNRLTMPDIITIDAPSVGDVAGVGMRVLTIRALWVELTSANLVYLSKSSAHQYQSGVKIDMRRGRKRTRAAQAACTDDAVEHDSNEQSESDDSHEEVSEPSCVIDKDPPVENVPASPVKAVEPACASASTQSSAASSVQPPRNTARNILTLLRAAPKNE